MFAQKNYPQTLGRNGTLTIAQAGCFLTAFCNLEARKGTPVDPPTLNNFFIAHDLYFFDEGNTYDLLAWSTITKYDPKITVVSTGTGAPSVDNAIVKFIYNNGTTHFCLVQDAAKGLILDSWDGQIKSWSVYGGPKEYATYKITEENDMSTIGDVEARIIIQRVYGYTNELDIESAVPGLVGLESNTALRAADASPTAAAFEQYINDLKKAAGGNFVPYSGPQLYTAAPKKVGAKKKS